MKIAFLVVFSVLTSFDAIAKEPTQRLFSNQLEIISDSKHHSMTVEIARTDRERAKGLMHRQSLAKNHGMLFIHPQPKIIRMWMKNTPLSLDMLFVDERGRILRIAEHTVPNSLAIISSLSKAKAVLEINAGSVSRMEIKIGDQISHPTFLQSR